MCVEFYPLRDEYAIGGVLTNVEKVAICGLVDFVKAASMCHAEVLALKESLQFFLEESYGSDSELEVRTSSKLLEDWLKEDNLAGWEYRFVRNKFFNIKGWFKNVLLVHNKSECLKWLVKWKEIANRSHNRTIFCDFS